MCRNSTYEVENVPFKPSASLYAGGMSVFFNILSSLRNLLYKPCLLWDNFHPCSICKGLTALVPLRQVDHCRSFPNTALKLC